MTAKQNSGGGMTNLLNYIKDFGHLTTAEKPFIAPDALALTQLVHLPMDDIVQPGFSSEMTMSVLGRSGLLDIEPKMYEFMLRPRLELLRLMCDAPRYSAWRLSGFVDRLDEQAQMQFCAVYVKMDDGRAAIAFRGTDNTLVGWKEDLNMSFTCPIPAQDAAKEYTERAWAHEQTKLVLCGHSKGGNLAVYTGAFANQPVQDDIAAVYTFDSPGLTPDALSSDGYAAISPRIDCYIPQSSVVGMLLSHHEAYTVVRSRSLGLLQHDPFTWQMEGDAFVTLPRTTLGSRLTDDALHRWLQKMDNDKRRLLSDSLFQILDATGAVTLGDLSRDWLKNALGILRATKSIDAESRKQLAGILFSLLSASAESVADMAMPDALKTFIESRLT